MPWLSFSHDELEARDRYKLLSGAIVPRPIALITTMASDGNINAAPFSFFNVLSADPGVVAIGLESNEDGSFKDTSQNIRESGEFVVNMVDRPMANAMKICAEPLAPGVEEPSRAGLATIPSKVVKPPRLEASPVSFECTRHTTLEISASRQIVLGLVRHLHFREGTVDPERMRINVRALNLIGRLAGTSYVGTTDIFSL